MTRREGPDGVAATRESRGDDGCERKRRERREHGPVPDGVEARVSQIAGIEQPAGSSGPFEKKNSLNVCGTQRRALRAWLHA